MTQGINFSATLLYCVNDLTEKHALTVRYRLFLFFSLSPTGSRIESILMSLPLNARWEYSHQPEAGSMEEKLMKVLKEPVDWIPLRVPAWPRRETATEA